MMINCHNYDNVIWAGLSGLLLVIVHTGSAMVLVKSGARLLHGVFVSLFVCFLHVEN